jgi:hypothetical protein
MVYADKFLSGLLDAAMVSLAMFALNFANFGPYLRFLKERKAEVDTEKEDRDVETSRPREQMDNLSQRTLGSSMPMS